MVKSVNAIADVSFFSLFLAIKEIPSQDVLAVRLFIQAHLETEKLKRRISQNMFEDLEKHKEAHRVLDKQLFIKNIFKALCSRSIV